MLQAFTRTCLSFQFFFILSLIGILHHEIWLDEELHFLIARDSNSLLQLFQVCRTEGHPVLWNILLFIITRFSSNPFWMQFVHISEGKDVSHYIDKERLKEEKVFILNATLRPAISAYTGEKFYGVENGQYLSYCHWDESLPDSVLKSKLNAALDTDSTSLVVSNSAIINLLDTTRLQRLASFDLGIFKGEDAIVYRYRK